MNAAVATVLSGLERGADGIYSAEVPAIQDQSDEVREREVVARRPLPDPLREVSRHHSIAVMDHEVRRFLDAVPRDGVVVDIGGGWGWHWRHLRAERPDVAIIVVDMVRDNLRLAVRILDTLVNDQVFLVHGDATALPFPSGIFHGYWSVQALQHVPAFEQAIREAHRILRPSGRFASYSLNRARMIEFVYRIMRRPYHLEGKRPGSFYLARGSVEQRRVIERVFGAPVVTRYSEVLFHPDLKLRTGAEVSAFGRVDARLSGGMPFLAFVARQRSYHVNRQTA